MLTGVYQVAVAQLGTGAKQGVPGAEFGVNCGAVWDPGCQITLL